MANELEHLGWPDRSDISLEDVRLLALEYLHRATWSHHAKDRQAEIVSDVIERFAEGKHRSVSNEKEFHAEICRLVGACSRKRSPRPLLPLLDHEGALLQPEKDDLDWDSMRAARDNAIPQFFARHCDGNESIASRRKHYRIRYTFCLRYYAEMKLKPIAKLLGASPQRVSEWYNCAVGELATLASGSAGGPKSDVI